MSDPSENDPGKRITTAWVVVAIDLNGDEGLPAFKVGSNWMPLVATDERRRDVLLTLARTVVENRPGVRVELRRFDGPYVVEETIG